MKIPQDLAERRRFYSEILRQCAASRSDRAQFNAMLRNYYLFGTKDTTGCYYNKISSTIDTLWSFMYSSDSAKFAIHLGTEATHGDLAKVPALVAEMNDQWSASRSNLQFALGGKWALVYGSMLFKTLWHHGKAKTFVVEPHQFGVYREDVMDLDDQEAFSHHYQITRSQLRNMIQGIPREKEIIQAVGVGGQPGDDKSQGNVNDGLGRLILSAPVAGPGIGAAMGNSPVGGGGTIDGGIGAVAGGQYNYVPQVEAELIDMAELFVWNDEINDYQVVTIAEPNIIVFDRANFYIPRSHPFVNLVPEQETYDYFWGTSFAARLTGLQDWRDERMLQIKELLTKQVNPPMLATGLSGIAEEKLQALNRADGIVSNNSPTGKIDRYTPTMPANTFSEIAEIDAMFGDLAGINPILQGQGAAGVRSHGQADLMARLGSSRVKQKALVAEESAARVGTLMMRNVQTYSDQRFLSEEKGPDGEPLTFLAEQFTSDFEIKVDSHSSSPVFVEDSKSLAEILLKARTIDRATFLDMMDPPNKQLLQEKLKVMEAKEAKQQEEMLKLKQQELQAKHGNPPGSPAEYMQGRRG
jgi:curved DNA-binding protein CbpA